MADLREVLERTRDVLMSTNGLSLEDRATAIAACAHWLEQLEPVRIVVDPDAHEPYGLPDPESLPWRVESLNDGEPAETDSPRYDHPDF